MRCNANMEAVETAHQKATLVGCIVKGVFCTKMGHPDVGSVQKSVEKAMSIGGMHHEDAMGLTHVKLDDGAGENSKDAGG